MRVRIIGRTKGRRVETGQWRLLRPNIIVGQLCVSPTIDVGLSKRDAAKQIRQKATEGIAPAYTQRSIIPDVHRRTRGDIGHGQIVGGEEEDATLAALRFVRELAVDVVELDADDHVGPLRVIAEKTAEAAVLRIGLVL